MNEISCMVVADLEERHFITLEMTQGSALNF